MKNIIRPIDHSDLIEMGLDVKFVYDMGSWVERINILDRKNIWLEFGCCVFSKADADGVAAGVGSDVEEANVMIVDEDAVPNVEVGQV